MTALRLALPVVVLGASFAPAQWRAQTIRTDADFRGLSVVSPSVAWVSGTKGTFGRTTDGGTTWSVATVAGAETLDFRDVEAFSATTAYLLSAGPGEASRIYKTTDGGKSWTCQFRNSAPDGFLDALAFWDEQNGIVLGDPVQGRFQVLTTDDGGAHWRPLATKDLPLALPKEGAFAASGTCLITRGTRDVWFVTGGARRARVFHSRDRGRTWTVRQTPIAAGVESAGIFSIAFRDRDHGLIVGGDYRKPEAREATVALTTDGGQSWVLAEGALPYCSAVAWAPDRWVAAGPSGTHVSRDGGKTWTTLGRETGNSLAFLTTGEGWVAGPRGWIARSEK